MPVTLESVRERMLQQLKASASSASRMQFQHVSFLQGYTGKDYEDAGKFVGQVIFEVCLQGLLYPESGSQGYTFFQMTDYGKQVLLDNPYAVYDADGYLHQLRSEITNLDETTAAYLQECLLAYNHGLYRSSAVMLGCASENLILILADACETKFVGSSIRKDKIKPTFEALATKLRAELNSELRSLDREWETHITQVFHNTRMSRNDAGHPEISRTISKTECYANLLLFPKHASLCNKIITKLGETNGG